MSTATVRHDDSLERFADQEALLPLAWLAQQALPLRSSQLFQQRRLSRSSQSLSAQQPRVAFEQ